MKTFIVNRINNDTEAVEIEITKRTNKTISFIPKDTVYCTTRPGRCRTVDGYTFYVR